MFYVKNKDKLLILNNESRKEQENNRRADILDIMLFFPQ